MPTYRKKPVEIQVVRLSHMESDDQGPFPVFFTNPPKWILDAMQLPEGSTGEVCWSTEGLKITTLEGIHLASPGDFIIKGVKGELYPCKPDIFAATYDYVSE